MMRQLSGAGLFGSGNGGGGLKGKMMRRVAGMAGLPDMSGIMGGAGMGDADDLNGMSAGLPSAPGKKKQQKKKARWKNKR